MAANNPEVIKRPQAILDLVETADFLAHSTSLAAADRFLAATEKTCAQLARMPGIGTPWEDEDPELTGVRSFPVAKFKKFLIFYRPTGEGIEILRVIHGARDTKRLLGDADGE